MKAEELMRFDWVHLEDDNTPRQVDCIRSGEVGLFGNKTVTPPYLEPIPLTAEILEQNGFKKKGYRYGIYDDYFDFEMHEYNDGTWLVSYHCCEMSLPDEQLLICYIHQLQHFMRHCGIEKEIEHRLVDVKGYDRGMAIDLFAFMDSLPNEPASNDLEEAAKIYTISLVVNEIIPDATVKQLREVADKSFKAGAQWQKEQILGDDNKQYHRLRHETLKRLYENEVKLELMLDKALEGYIEKYEQIGGHNYLSLKIPMLSKPDDCKDGDKIKLIILKKE